MNLARTSRHLVDRGSAAGPRSPYVIMNILLIDGKNTAYRAAFAARGTFAESQNKYHPFVMWLRLTNMILEKFKPVATHIFWDCPKNDVWRKRVFAEYKDNRDSMPHYADDVQQELGRLIAAAKDILPYMGVRQYEKASQESDDLIYTACELLRQAGQETRVVIVSSDSDFAQLQWSMPHVSVYDPKRNAIIDHPTISPVVLKALSGDRSDNIDGYRGIGPVKGKQLVQDKKKLIEFLDAVGDHKFKRNLALIDMSMNPARLSNMLYVMRVMCSDIQFDKSAINVVAMKHKILGLSTEYPKVALSFKRLV